MKSHDVIEDIEVIKKAYNILEKGYGFYDTTIRMKGSFFYGLSEADYKKLDYKLKAIRQDFAKILVIMNSIDKTYSDYQKKKYIPAYISLGLDAMDEELGCFIEYLFAKYRVILEYIGQILEICIPPRLSNTQKEQYGRLTKVHKKYNFLLKYIADNIGERNDLLNMEWFQKLRIERDFIIHDGATCMVLHNEENLLFKVMTTDALDKESEDELNSFFSNNEGLIYYSAYWALYISKLILFGETIFEFLLRESEMSDSLKWQMSKYPVLFERTEFIDSDNGTKVPDRQDVLVNLLKSMVLRLNIDN